MTEQLTAQEAVQRLLAADKPPEAPQNTPEEQKDKGEAPPTEERDDPPPVETDEEDDDTEPDDDAEPSEPEEPLYTVVIDGKEEQVNLKQLLSGYQRGSDYSRKTAALVEEKRKVQAWEADYQQKLAQASALITALEQNYEGKEPDWVKIAKEEGHESFLLKREQWRVRQEERGRLQQAQAKIAEEQKRVHQEGLKRHVEEERTKLLEKLPAWRDPAKAKAEREQLVTYAQTLGFSAQELENVTDHRAVLALRKAMLFDKQRELKAQRKREAKALTPGKPATKAEVATRGEKDAFARLKKSGSAKDAVALLLARGKSKR